MEQLLQDQVNQICMFMRVMDVMKGNQHIVDQSPEMKKSLEELSLRVAQMFELLTDEQRDQVLEEHKMQLDAMNSKKKRKKAKH